MCFRFLDAESIFTDGSFSQVWHTQWAAKMATIFHTGLSDAQLHAYDNNLSFRKFTDQSQAQFHKQKHAAIY